MPTRDRVTEGSALISSGEAILAPLAAPSLPDPVVQTPYRVLYRDVDRMGVLYYSRYLDLFEMGRTEWARAQGWRYRDMEDVDGLMLPVTRARCRYLAPVRFDDEALVRTAMLAWSRATLRYGFEVRSAEEDRLCAEGEVELACVTRAGARPAPLPERLLGILRRVAPDREGRKRGD